MMPLRSSSMSTALPPPPIATFLATVAGVRRRRARSRVWVFRGPARLDVMWRLRVTGTTTRRRPCRSERSNTPATRLRDFARAMKAMIQTRYGPPERVLGMQELEPPTVRAGDALVRVRATSVNTPDWITVTGVPYILRLAFGLRRPRSPVRGTDVAGVVEAVAPDVTDLQPGDEVFGSSWTGTLSTRGTFAELTAVPASNLASKPASLSFEEAAASVMSGLTALTAMQTLGKVTPGMRVLINGASGGVGTFAVQIARSLGAEVT